MTQTITVGVLALQGAFIEHVTLLKQAAHGLKQQYTASSLSSTSHNGGIKSAQAITIPSTTEPPTNPETSPSISIIQVRNPTELSQCHALIIPGGESTAISLIAERTGLLEPLRDFVKIQRKPVWGTCAGLILLAESANKSKSTGQELIGGLDVRVHRNYFGRQVESFEADLDLAFLSSSKTGDLSGGKGTKFHSVFIRAPVVEKILLAETELPQTVSTGEDSVLAPPRQATVASVEVLARLPGRARALKDLVTTASDLGEDGDIVAVRQGNVFGTAFHPELTGDARIHAWWLGEVVSAVTGGGEAGGTWESVVRN